MSSPQPSWSSAGPPDGPPNGPPMRGEDGRPHGELAALVMQRPTGQLVVEAIGPVLAIMVVPVGFAVMGAESVDVDLVVARMVAVYLALSILSLLWVGRERVELSTTGIRIVRRVGSTEIAWWQIRSVEVRRRFGQGFIHLAGPEGDAQVFAPNSGLLFVRDQMFEAKVATLEHWWQTHRSAMPLPGSRPPTSTR